MKYLSFSSFIFGLTLLLSTSGCQKDDPDTLQLLYTEYHDGEISECQWKGELVYVAGHNAFDAGAKVYNAEGKEIATCNWAWGPIDEMCDSLENCEVIYRVAGNIWGTPAVDKYGISR